jgi:polar amino acid transport system substrate-binding protein
MSDRQHNTVARALPRAFALATALILVLIVLTPMTASAVELEKTTARSNSATSNDIIGGEPTRVTWEASVGDDEQLDSLTLVFPEGSSLAEGATVRATVLDGTIRVETEYEDDLSESQVTLRFIEPVPSGLLLRVEIYNIVLPDASGDYSFTGTYSDAQGSTYDLPASPTIHVTGTSTADGLVAWLKQQPWVESWNSVTFFKIFLNPLVAAAAIPNLFIGWLRSFGLVLVGFPLAIPVGLGISFLRMSRFRLLRFISSIYVNVIRGTPLFLQIFIAFLGLPLMGIRVGDYVLGTLVLAINSSAYLAEIFRAGIQSIHKGQFEAASSLGMNGVQTMFSVIIPQTVRRVIPTMTSEFILLYKDTSLLAAMGVMEQMQFARSMVATTGGMTPYVISGCYYLIVTLPLTRVISIFEKKLAASDGREAPPEDREDDQGKDGEKKPRTKRVGLFKTIAPLSATDSDSGSGITPEQHDSQ